MLQTILSNRWLTYAFSGLLWIDILLITMKKFRGFVRILDIISDSKRYPPIQIIYLCKSIPNPLNSTSIRINHILPT